MTTMKRISPVNQAGSWQLEHYLVVVGKSQGSGHPVQILNMPKMTIFSHEMHWDVNACEAARAALRKHFGSDSDEYREFLRGYGYDCTGSQPEHFHRPFSPEPKQSRGTKITDLEGTPGSTAFEVYLGRKHINTVYFDSDMSTEDVRRSLIEHDHLHPEIRVYRARVIRGGVGELPSWVKR